MGPLPTGTVTFLFTDLEGSTRLWEEFPEAMRDALARHDELLREAVEKRGGYVVKTTGDGLHATFSTAHDAVLAAIDAQLALEAEPWSLPRPLRARMGLHTGETEIRDGDYYGAAVNRAARVAAVAHGGQIVCSRTTEAIVRDDLPPETRLIDLGEHRLRDLARPVEVFQIAHDGLSRDFPALRSLDAFPGNLPFQLSSFIGREADVERVETVMGDSRVTTLTGVGGVGKTRLALQVAADMTPRFRDGAWLCELAPVRDPEMVADAIASVFGVTARAGETLEQSLVEFLRGKELLLVLDNCEHLLEPAAALVETIERACRDAAVLATSREGLGIDGERILAVRSLSSPQSDQDTSVIAEAASVQLFVDRAQAAVSEFGLTDKNAAAVAQICRQLDGVPLAIELAAARVPAMNPTELAKRLDQRFQVLAGGRRGAVERHQTLRAAIDWSYDLLTGPEQVLLTRLTVFRGGCTLEAAETVCSGGQVPREHVWDLLASLVARSLVVAEDLGFETRYRLLETIRQYGEERLNADELASLRREHAEYFVRFAAEFGEQVHGPQQFEAGERFAPEHENVLAVVALAQDLADPDLAFRLIDASPPPLLQAGFELRLPFDSVITIPGAPQHELYPLGLALTGIVATSKGDLESGERLARQALDALVPGSPLDLRVRFIVNLTRSYAAFNVGDWRSGAMLQEETVPLLEAMGDRVGLATALAAIASQYVFGGDHDAALPPAEESVRLAEEIGMPTLVAMSRASLAAALTQRDPERARAVLGESLAVNEAVGHAFRGEPTQATLVATMLRDDPVTLRVARQAIPLLHWSGDTPQLAGILNVAARAVATSDPGRAATIQGASRQFVPKAQGTAASPLVGGVVVDARREATAIVREAIGDDGLRARRAEGEALDPDAAVAYALAAIDAALTASA